ncbi:MAG TPA: hypothetical protein VF950_27650 [Planctomycetota bacterium]
MRGTLTLGLWVLLAVPAPSGWALRPQDAPDKPAPVDMARARELLRKQRSGEALSPEEAAYLKRAMEERRGAAPPPAAAPRATTGFKPLDEMGADDRYKGEDGGLYGGGKNVPPDALRAAAEAELAKTVPLDAAGKPAADGRVVLLSISMSNATQEFSRFKRIADADPAKSGALTIVDGAQGGQAMAEWAPPDAPAWAEAERRLKAAGVSTSQVQLAWIKLANKGPSGDLAAHVGKLKKDTQAVIRNAKARFPNLRIAYLSSRIYGGYAHGNLNPEPYAYESAFAVRGLVQEQKEAPLLLWGPYLWGDGTTPRKSDGLVWTREDLAGDGTHPSESGRDKVARLLLGFFKSDPLAKPWFTAR